jgi:hypothetical protein
MLHHLAILSCLILSTNAWSGILLDSYRSTQLYFPTTSPHSVGNVPFNLPHCSQGETVVMLNGLAYFIGSQYCTNSTNAMFIFDPKTNTSTKAQAQTPYSTYIASTVMNGMILLCNYYSNVGSCYTYSSVSQNWTMVAPMEASVSGFTLTTINNEAYVFGGSANGACYGATNAVYKYNKQWELIGLMPMINATSGHAVLTLSNDTALVCGGYASNGSFQCTATPNCYIYTASKDEWKHAKPMATARVGAAMVMLAGIVAWFYNVLDNTIIVFQIVSTFSAEVMVKTVAMCCPQ